jgi:hypothetical protein
LGCRTRFLFGVNYAWKNFGIDFGGSAAWAQRGVSRAPDRYCADFAVMRDHGVNAVRWWLLPDFRSEAVVFSAEGAPQGLGGTVTDDITKALEIAARYDVYLIFSLFSFDAFRPTREERGASVRGLSPIIRSPALRRELIEKVLRPIAKTVASSPYAGRLAAWDLMNEPEWVITGTSQYGDPDFEPRKDVDPVTHAELETFLREVLTMLRTESKAQVTVGSAAVKWKHAWSKLDLDFREFHVYEWVNDYFPYTRSPAEWGLADKPLVMGEFPIRGFKPTERNPNAVPTSQLLQSFYADGYAGALAWDFSGGADALPVLRDFSAAHACETRF